MGETPFFLGGGGGGIRERASPTRLGGLPTVTDCVLMLDRFKEESVLTE